MTNTFMKNSVIKDLYIIKGEFKYRDYTDGKYRGIRELPDSILNNYIEYYRVQDNTKLELVSYQLYSSENYWDILILINKMDPLFDMPTDFNNIFDNSCDDVLEYVERTKVVISDQHKQLLRDQLVSKRTLGNEKFRVIKIIAPSKLQDFLKLIRIEGYSS